MISFNAILEKFAEKGEKTGWVYIEISASDAQLLKPGNKKIFRVKGRLDAVVLAAVSVFPMGDGSFILPVNASMRKALGKREGAMVSVALEADNTILEIDADLLECLSFDENALQHFSQLPLSHQRYFSNWIQAAKTDATKTKRLSQAVDALSRNMNYAEMIRSLKAK